MILDFRFSVSTAHTTSNPVPINSNLIFQIFKLPQLQTHNLARNIKHNTQYSYSTLNLKL